MSDHDRSTSSVDESPSMPRALRRRKLRLDYADLAKGVFRYSVRSPNKATTTPPPKPLVHNSDADSTAEPGEPPPKRLSHESAADPSDTETEHTVNDDEPSTSQPNKTVKRKRFNKNDPHCILCYGSESTELDENGRISVGTLQQFTLDNGKTIHLHFLCALFDGNLCQKMDEKLGLFGFAPRDILAESRRGMRLTCTYCKRKNALVGCWNKSCKTSMHLGCALASGETFHEYYEHFRSYCVRHHPQQIVFAPRVVPRYGRIFASIPTTAFTTCSLCLEILPTRASAKVIRTDCCLRPVSLSRINRWYHRECIQKYAFNQGWYQIRCPHCCDGVQADDELNDTFPTIAEQLLYIDTRGFRRTLLVAGVYIPQRDQVWEAENVFEDQAILVCEAPTCLCPVESTASEEIMHDLHQRLALDSKSLRSSPEFLARLRQRMYNDQCPNRELSCVEDEKAVECLPWEIVACDACGVDTRHLKCRAERYEQYSTCQKYVCRECEENGREAVVMEKEEDSMDEVTTSAHLDDVNVSPIRKRTRTDAILSTPTSTVVSMDDSQPLQVHSTPLNELEKTLRQKGQPTVRVISEQAAEDSVTVVSDSSRIAISTENLQHEQTRPTRSRARAARSITLDQWLQR